MSSGGAQQQTSVTKKGAAQLPFLPVLLLQQRR